jgi:membrane protein involved in colicin uptake
MKNIVKKLAIYSMIGIMQVGFGASIVSASPIHSQKIVQVGYHHHDNDRQREHDDRLRKENQRHDREMRRRAHESEREWHQRQERERERHDRELRDIAALLIGIAIGSASN